MTYSDDGIYVPSKHGGTPVAMTRKVKRAISRLCLTNIEAIQYSHRSNTERVRGPYAGYAVRAWKKSRTVIEAIPKG